MPDQTRKSAPPPGYENSGSWGFSQKHERQASLDPLARRLLYLVAGLSVLLIALVGFAWLRGDGETAFNPIAQAAERTAATGGGRAVFDVDISPQGGPAALQMHGQGVFTGAPERARVTMSTSLPNGKSLRIESVTDRRTVYVRSPIMARTLPGGKQWLGTKPYLGNDPETALAGAGDLRQQLEMLQATGGEVETVGEETVRGVSTTHYRSTIDLRRAAAQFRQAGEAGTARVIERLAEQADSTIPVEVWVDDDGVVRRMHIVETIPGEDGKPSLEMDMRIDLFDFGIEPKVALPPPGRVLDTTPLLRAKLGLFGGGEPRAPAAKAERPRSRAAFRAELNDVCQGLKREFAPLSKRAVSLNREVARVARSEGVGSRATLRAFQRLAAGLYQPLVRMVDRTLGRIEAIGPPPGMAVQYRRYIRISTTQLGLMRATTRALQLGEYRLVKRLENRIERLGKRTKKLARELGGSACESID